jgi:hypothetical protein
MALFIIERTFAEKVETATIDRDCIKAVNDDVGIRWMYSFVSADRRNTFCLYEAPNTEALREAAARLDLPVDEITEVEHLPATVGGT